MPRSSRWFVLAAATAVFAAGITAAVERHGDLSGAPVELVARVAFIADPREVHPEVGPAARLPLLPVPESPPADPYVDEPVIEQGRLAIPRIGLDVPFYEGVSLTVIDNGPSHWPGTAMPGQLGNVVIGGHRATHSRPFRHLDLLQPGDHAIFTTPSGVFTYEFTGHQIVTPEQIEIIDQTAEYRATFFSCHPPGSARERIVAFWRLVDAPAA